MKKVISSVWCKQLSLILAIIARNPLLFFVVFFIRGIFNAGTFISGMSIVYEFTDADSRRDCSADRGMDGRSSQLSGHVHPGSRHRGGKLGLAAIRRAGTEKNECLRRRNQALCQGGQFL